MCAFDITVYNETKTFQFNKNVSQFENIRNQQFYCVLNNAKKKGVLHFF